jgi:hypothetical protein
VEEAEFSPVYGEIITAPVLRLSCKHVAPVEAAAVLLPSAVSSSLRCLHVGPSPAIYEWRDGGRIWFLWFSEDLADREALGWRTDAAFVLLANDADGAVESIALAGASYLETHGRKVFNSVPRVDFLEWQPGDPAPAIQLWNPEALTGPQLA